MGRRNRKVKTKLLPKMKTIAAIVTLAVADKKVPPRHPLQRLAKLNSFANEWLNDNMDAKVAAHWGPKFDRNTARFERRFELCGYYDETNLPHGGPSGDRKRRDDGGDLMKYDKENPMKGLLQITNGFRKWAERYIEDCKLQPGKQSDRAAKWRATLQGKLAAKLA